MFKASQMKKENEILKALEIINSNIARLLFEKNIDAEQFPRNSKNQKKLKDSQMNAAECDDNDTDDDSDDMAVKEDTRSPSLIPAWANGLGKGIIVDLNDEEKKFWNDVIKKYLYPINRDKEEEKKAQEDLVIFRTNMCFAMIMINLLWMCINFMFQHTKPSEIHINNMKVELFSFVFLLFFTAIFTIQFFGMLMHRWGTFLHIISYTNIGNPFKKKQHKDKNLNKECCREIIRKLRYEPLPDYEDRDEIPQLQKEFEEKVERHIEQTAKEMQEERNVEKNIKVRNIGCVLRKSQKHENRTIGLTMYRKVTSPTRKLESRYDRKGQQVGFDSRINHRRNFQFVSRKNLRKDVDRLLQQSRMRHNTPGPVHETDINEN